MSFAYLMKLMCGARCDEFNDEAMKAAHGRRDGKWRSCGEFEVADDFQPDTA